MKLGLALNLQFFYLSLQVLALVEPEGPDCAFRKITIFLFTVRGSSGTRSTDLAVFRAVWCQLGL